MRDVVAFLPLKTKVDGHRKDYSGNLWRAQALLASLEHHLTEELDLIIACPDCEVENLRECLISTKKLRIEVISEDNIIDGIGAAGCHGWYKQQAMTLEFASRQNCVTLRLDPDIWLVRPLAQSDLWRDGKSANDIWPKDHQPNDCRYAQKILGTALHITPALPGIGDTPMSFHPELARGLMDFLSRRDYTPLRLAHQIGWTEIALYSLYADLHGGVLNYHFKQPLHGTRILGRNELGKKIDPEDGFFAILNSRLDLPEDRSKRIMGMTL